MIFDAETYGIDATRYMTAQGCIVTEIHTQTGVTIELETRSLAGQLLLLEEPMLGKNSYEPA